MIVGNVIEPKLLGILELHPITVLLSLIFWGIIWGIAGMLLAAPITAVCKILLESGEIATHCQTLGRKTFLATSRTAKKKSIPKK